MADDVARTLLILDGLQNYVSGQNAIAQGWRQAAGAQDVYARSAQRMSSAGNLLTAGVTAPLAGIVAASLKMGIAATESESMVKATFGGMTADINAWSDNASKRLGVNAYAMRQQAATMQAMFTGAGFDPSKAEGMSKGIVDLKNDMVSFFNVADSDATAALQSGLAGETEPLRRYGIFLTEAGTAAYAYSHGLAAANSKLTEQQKIQARFGLIKDTLQKNNVTGDLERTKDSPANLLRREQAALVQAGTDFGMALLPLAKPGIEMLNALLPPLQAAVDLFTKLPQPIQATGLALALGAGPALKLGGFLLNLKSAANLATEAKKGLRAATIADTLAEQAKAAVAGEEGAAIKGVGDAAKNTAGKLGLLSKVKGLAQGAAAWGGEAATIGGKALPNLTGGLVSKGGAVMGAALGVGAAVGARDDLKTLGVGEGAADLYAGILGAVTAGVTTFYPPARVLVGAAEIFRAGVNRFYNAPMEKAATEGTQTDAETKAVTDEKDPRKRADLYNTMARKAYDAGDNTTGESYQRVALSLIKQSKHPAQDEQRAANGAPSKDKMDSMVADARRRMQNPDAYADDPSGALPDTSMLSRLANIGGNTAGSASAPSRQDTVTDQRDGTQIVRLPARAADRFVARVKRHNDLNTQY